MAHLYKDTGVKSLYADRKFMGGKDAWQDALEASTTLYIGNLSFFTTEEQVLVGPHCAGLTYAPAPQPGRSSLRQSCPDPRPGLTPTPTLSSSTSSSHGAAS